MEFLLKVHDAGIGRVVALCDKNILGTKFSEGDITLNVDSDFFGGNPATIEDIKEAIESAQSANIIGNSIVSLLLKHTLISPSGINTIGGIKHAHIYRL